MKSPMRIFDPSFCYVPSWATDIRETFKRANAAGDSARPGSQTVVPLKTNGSSVHEIAEIQPGRAVLKS